MKKKVFKRKAKTELTTKNFNSLFNEFLGELYTPIKGKKNKDIVAGLKA